MQNKKPSDLQSNFSNVTGVQGLPNKGIYWPLLSAAEQEIELLKTNPSSPNLIIPRPNQPKI